MSTFFEVLQGRIREKQLFYEMFITLFCPTYAQPAKDIGFYIVLLVGQVLIKDEQIMHSINTLISRGYDVITKDNNTVSFQRWSNLDAGRGIAFSIDGTQPNLQFITKLEKIRESNWYYYEEDFNEWNLKNE